jgi:hypothetical protein
MIAVNRGPQYSAPFRYAPGSRPAPRPLDFDGRSIAPMEASIHPVQRGPLGEGFTTALVRTHPEMAATAIRGPGYRAIYTGSPAMRAIGGPGGHSTAGLASHSSSSGVSHATTSSSSASHASSSGGGGASHASSGGGGGSGGGSHPSSPH